MIIQKWYWPYDYLYRILNYEALRSTLNFPSELFAAGTSCPSPSEQQPSWRRLSPKQTDPAVTRKLLPDVVCSSSIVDFVGRGAKFAAACSGLYAFGAAPASTSGKSAAAGQNQGARVHLVRSAAAGSH